ncbi:MAG TPA: heparan-alpha-glucosaminide N-acetyltransferase domain-containing protein, partial [Polyangiales bacterium]
VRRRFTRALQIVAIGYLLQAHTPAIYFDPARAPGAFRALFRCEVLQCIGISLLVLELIALRARSAQQLVIACAGLALVLFSLAPLAEVASRGGSASLLKGLLGHGQGSQFPLFPWSGYVFAGVVVGAAVLPEAGRTPGFRRVGGLLACAAAIAIMARATVSPSLVQASSTPSFVLEKLSVIALVLCALELLSRRIRKLPRVLTILGGETLAIFVFHLQLIYGGKWAFAHRFGRTLDWPHALAVASLNIVASIAFGLAWYGLKQGVALLRKRYASLSVSQADCSERSVT